MMKLIKQARAALAVVKPDEVRKRAARPISVGLVAANRSGYQELEDFLAPGTLAGDARDQVVEQIHRAHDPNPPVTVDLVIYSPAVTPPAGAYVLDPAHPQATIREILHDHENWGLPLARQFPAFRPQVTDSIVQSICRENALFAIATALPNVIPNLIELPWAFGEFASDTAFLTANQVRMAFLIAAACDKKVGLAEQKGQILTMVGGAFGWRALARELVGLIPLGGGLIPKGAIAYAGTYLVGKSLEYYHQVDGGHFSRAERKEVYREGLSRAKEVTKSLVTKSVAQPSAASRRI